MLEVVERVVALALGTDRLVSTGLPRAGRVTVRAQPDRARDVVHLLHATPALRGRLWDADIQLIQDIVPLFDVAVSLRIDRPVTAVRLVPSGAALPFGIAAGRVAFTVPRMDGHAMVEVCYGETPDMPASSPLSAQAAGGR